MKTAWTLLTLILISHLSFGQEDMLFMPYRDGKKWSVATENGDVLFKPKFEETYPSITNRIRFKQNGKYGFTNQNGDIIIKAIYQEATDFYYFGGIIHAYVTKNDSTVSISLDGNPIKAKVGCGGVISNSPNGLFVFKVNEKYGVIALGNDTIIQPIFKHIKNYDDGYFVVAQDFTDAYGILNSLGDTIYAFTLDSIAKDRTNIRAPVYKIYENGKVGIMDRAGELQALPKYEDVKPYRSTSVFCFQAFKNGKLLGYIYKGRTFWE